MERSTKSNDGRSLFGFSDIAHSPSIARSRQLLPESRSAKIRESMQRIYQAVDGETSIRSAVTPRFGTGASLLSNYSLGRANESKINDSWGNSFACPFPSARPEERGVDNISLALSEPDEDFGATRYLFNPEISSVQIPAQRHDLDDEPVACAYLGLFNDFKHCLMQSKADVMQQADLYEEMCEDREAMMKKIIDDIRTDTGLNLKTALNLMQSLKEEKQTWRIVYCLYKDRLEPKDEEMATAMEFMSEKEVIQKYMHDDDDIRQAQIVIDWLERNASDDLSSFTKDVDAYIGGVMWENTVHHLKQASDRGEEPNPKFITQIDPDAPTRQKKSLMDLDNEDEAKLLKIIYAFIRAGRIVEAQNFCVAHGQAWRAATLEGWRLYHDPNFANDVDARAPPDGNAGRKLWKATCWALANTKSYSVKERAIYGSLSGNLEAMLADCATWEDSVWAHYKAMVDVAIEQRLQQCPHVRRPWQARSLFNSASISLPASFWSQRVSLDDRDPLFDAVAASHNQEVRQQAKEPYHFVQRCVILSDFAKLAAEMRKWVEEDNDPQLFRFLAHLLLFFRYVQLPLETEVFDAVMSKYVAFLARDPRTCHLVATYTATLSPDRQLTSYTQLLERVEDSDTRKRYLQLAKDAGLDIPRITKNVVDRIRAAGSDAPTTAIGGDRSMIGVESVSDEDRRKINAIEWLVFDPSQRFEAIKQCNAVVRNFLGGGKYTAAKEVICKLPMDSVDVVYTLWKRKADDDVPLPAEVENGIREYLCIRCYLDAHGAFADWFKHQHSEKPQLSAGTAVTTTKSAYDSALTGDVSISHLVAEEHRQKKQEEEIRSWNSRLEFLCDAARDKIYNVLLFPGGGWLVDQFQQEDDDEEARSRRHQMSLLRQLCVPALCNLLLTVLLDTGGRNGECGKLANVVADPQLTIYKLFSKVEGRQLLERIQNAMLDTL